jgi:hypothetical protein
LFYKVLKGYLEEKNLDLNIIVYDWFEERTIKLWEKRYIISTF